MGTPSKRLFHVAVMLFGLSLVTIVVIRVAVARAAVKDDDLLPVDSLQDTRATGSSRKPSDGQRLDLLDTVKVSQDSVAGIWGFDSGALITSTVQWGRLQIPCIPPEEYDLRVHLTRKKGTDSFNLGFIFGGKQAMAVIDGRDGETSWLTLIGTTNIADNATTVNGRQLRWAKPSTILLSVRRQGVTLAIDDRTIIHWTGSPSDLEMQPGYLVPDRKCLFIGSWESAFRIDEYVLIPVLGLPTLLR